MENNLKLTFFQQCEVNGVSKKGCSDGIKIGNNQHFLIGTENFLYKLQLNESRYILNPIKSWAKNDDENYLLLGSAQRNKEEAYFYICTFNHKDDSYHLMIFRNDFRDQVETVKLPFKPLRTEPISAFDRFYIFVGGETKFLLFVLVSKKDKKFELVEVNDLPDTFVYEDSLASMEVRIFDFQLFIAMGFFDGTFNYMSYKLDIDQGADKLGSRFFAKILNDYATFNLQLPITSVHLVHMKEADDSQENMSVVAASSLGYVILADNFIQNKFENAQVVVLKDETNPETVTDTLVADIDGDGVKEIVVLTHLGGIYILKLIEVHLSAIIYKKGILKIVESKQLEGAYYDVFLDVHGDKKFLVLFGDNSVKIFQITQ